MSTMPRRQFLQHAAHAAPIAAVGIQALAAQVQQPMPAPIQMVDVSWLEATLEPGWLRLRVVFDRQAALAMRGHDEIVLESLRQADAMIAAIEQDLWASRMVPVDGIEVGGKWQADTFLRKPDPESKLPHHRDPKGSLRYLLVTVLAEDLLVHVWHRQGRLFMMEDVKILGELIDRVSPCPGFVPVEVRFDQPSGSKVGGTITECPLSPDELRKLAERIQERYQKVQRNAQVILQQG